MVAVSGSSRRLARAGSTFFFTLPARERPPRQPRDMPPLLVTDPHPTTTAAARRAWLTAGGAGPRVAQPADEVTGTAGERTYRVLLFRRSE